MGQYNKMTITKQGLSMLLSAQSMLEAIIFTNLGTGDGAYDGTEDMELMTDLKQKKNTFAINSVSQESDTKLKIRCLVTNDNIAIGYDITEIGVYGKLGTTGETVLFGVTDAVKADFIPSKDIAPSSILFEMYLEVANCDNVNFEYVMPEGMYELAINAKEKYELLHKLEYPEFDIPEDMDNSEGLVSGENFFKTLGKLAVKMDRLEKALIQLNKLNNLTRYTTTKVSNPTVGEQITQIDSTDFDLETGNPIPFPIQDVVKGHEKAINKLNTDMEIEKNKIRILLNNHNVQPGITVYTFGNFGYYRCGMILVHAASGIMTESTVLLVSTLEGAKENAGYLKIMASNCGNNGNETAYNHYYLYDAQLCIHNVQSVNEYLTVKFIPFF